MRLLLVTMVTAPLVVLWPRRSPAEQRTTQPTDTGRVPGERGPVVRRRRSLRQRWAAAFGKPDDDGAREVFAVLEMQMRLATVTATLRRIDTHPDMFARQHHWRTTLWAYDSLLAEACALAGVTVHAAPAGPKADAERQRRELELYGRGWTW